MDPALENLGWTDEHWNRICATVTEEAQKARTAAQLIPLCRPGRSHHYRGAELQAAIASGAHARRVHALERLVVDSDPSLPITKIAVNIPLRSHEVADPNLTAALGMFRRAARRYIARVEDALVFGGRPGTDLPPPHGLSNIPDVVRVTEAARSTGSARLIPAPDRFVRVPVSRPARVRAGDTKSSTPSSRFLNASTPALNSAPSRAP